MFYQRDRFKANRGALVLLATHLLSQAYGDRTSDHLPKPKSANPVANPVLSAPVRPNPNPTVRQRAYNVGFNPQRLSTPPITVPQPTKSLMTAYENLESCLADSRAARCKFNYGKDYRCQTTYHACIAALTKDENFLPNALACKSDYQRCRRTSKTDFKFNCHDFAFESCRQLKKAKFPAWIFGVNDSGTQGGHAMVLIRDVTAPEAQQPRYCIHEPQDKNMDKELCYTATEKTSTGRDQIPLSIIDTMTEKIKHYAPTDKKKLTVNECDESYYTSRNENPWWTCTPDPGGRIEDPTLIPRNTEH